MTVAAGRSPMGISMRRLPKPEEGRRFVSSLAAAEADLADGSSKRDSRNSSDMPSVFAILLLILRCLLSYYIYR